MGVAVVVALLAGLLGSVAVANGGAGDVFYACLTNGGAIGKVSTEGPPDCKGATTLVSWNSEGPQGLPGADGVPGSVGPPGSPGAGIGDDLRVVDSAGTVVGFVLSLDNQLVDVAFVQSGSTAVVRLNLFGGYILTLGSGLDGIVFTNIAYESTDCTGTAYISAGLIPRVFTYPQLGPGTFFPTAPLVTKTFQSERLRNGVCIGANFTRSAGVAGSITLPTLVKPVSMVP